LSLCAIWGFTQVTIKVANEGMSPLLQAGLRSAGSALLLWAYALARRVPLFERDGSLGFGLTIAALFAGEFVFLYWGLVFTTAARGILVIYTSPFVVALGAHWFIPGERLHARRIAGLACAFAGLVLAFADALTLPTWRELVGDGLEFLAAPLAAFSFWTPIFGMLASWLLLGEPVTAALGVAMVFVATGIYLVSRA